MNELIRNNRQFLTDLFTGKPVAGHGIITHPSDGLRIDHPVDPGIVAELGDFAVSDRPVAEWLPIYRANYERQLATLETLRDDTVPYIGLNTNTGIFASAFGCKFHVYKEETNACALNAVETADEADALGEGNLNAPALERVFELGHLLQEELGSHVPIGVPDIQSPFDIAALIWKKEDLFPSMIERPESVHTLVDKCYRLLTRFLDKFIQEFPECNLCHCPTAWAPPKLGMWLSEDEVGAFSPAMFEEFCLPTLTKLSERYGGMFIHCCADADYQYNGFRKIPNFRGLNRSFTRDPKYTIDEFSGRSVLIVAWQGEDSINHLLDIATPETRFLFDLTSMPLDETKAVLERLRARCGRCDTN